MSMFLLPLTNSVGVGRGKDYFCCIMYHQLKIAAAGLFIHFIHNNEEIQIKTLYPYSLF